MGDVDFLVGRRLEQVRVGQSVQLVFSLGEKVEPELYANVEQAFFHRDHLGAEVGSRFDQQRAVAALVASLGAVVQRAEVVADGTLRIAFSEGSEFWCPRHPDYEAWQVVGGSPQYLVVCTPGGGEPTVWDSSHTPTAEDANEAIERLREVTGWEVGHWELTPDGRIIINPAREDARGTERDSR